MRGRTKKPAEPFIPTMTDDGRRVLELLANTPNGASEALLLARGFSRGVIFELLQAGLVTKTQERTFAPGQPIYIDRVVITDAGRVAIS
jgi:hypothetical protein